MKTEEDAALRRSSFFQFLPDDVFEKISSLLKEEHYEFGDIIVHEGDPADAVYVLTSGRARATKIMPNRWTSFDSIAKISWSWSSEFRNCDTTSR